MPWSGGPIRRYIGAAVQRGRGLFGEVRTVAVHPSLTARALPCQLRRAVVCDQLAQIVRHRPAPHAVVTGPAVARRGSGERDTKIRYTKIRRRTGTVTCERHAAFGKREPFDRIAKGG